MMNEITNYQVLLTFSLPMKAWKSVLSFVFSDFIPLVVQSSILTKQISNHNDQILKRFGDWRLGFGHCWVIGFWLLVIAPSALACSCAPQSPQEYFDNADAVFTGKAVDIDQGWGDLEIKFAVLEISKMEEEVKSIMIHTAVSSAECGYTFKAGEIYVVHAIFQDGRFYTDLCSGTHRFLGR